MSLYETLGVAKDAAAATIKKAFRSKAKTAHPDAGGDAETFGALALAYDILSDPGKRQRYDETGKVDNEPDNTDAQAMGIISAFVDRFLSDEKAKHKDMILELRKAVNGEIATARRSIREGQDYETRAVDVRKRIKGKDGALLARMVDRQIEQAQTAIRTLENQISVRERALLLIDDAKFDFEAEAVSPYAGMFRSEAEMSDMERAMHRYAMNNAFR